MPVVRTKRDGRTCYKVRGVKTKKCLTKTEAEKQLAAIEISKRKK